MPMHDVPFVNAFVREEWPSDPKQIVGRLFVERTVGIYAGVNEKAEAVIMLQRE